MDKFYEQSLEHLEVFFKGNLNTSDEIFKALKSVIGFKNAYIYFLTPDILRLEYSYGSARQKKEISLDKTDKESIFSAKRKIPENIFKIFGKNIEISRLTIRETVYGILVIETNKPLDEENTKLFHLCSLIISNIIKELELTQIIKMQTEALQQGLIEKERANLTIKKQNKKIIASDKIKTQFLSNISHELRTPLNSIIGFSELLQNPKSGSLTEIQKEFVKDIQTAGIHLLGMINEILDMTKIESCSMRLNIREFDCNRCILETVNILKPLIERKNIKLVQDTESILICADYQKLQQILFNIINNAIKYSPESGTITISSRGKRKYIEIKIKDEGCGIEKKYHKKIFKKFEQINPKENSTGLGLAITRELVILHGGTIKVTSERDKGAEFTVKLPLSSD